MRKTLAAVAVVALLVPFLPGQALAARGDPSFRFVGDFGDLVRDGENYAGASTTWWNSPDGVKDAVFKLTLPATTARDVASLKLRCGGGWWDTVANDGAWAIGVTSSDRRTTTLLNTPQSTYTADLANGLSVYLHVKDAGYWMTRAVVTLTVTYTSGSPTELTTYAH